MENSEGVFVVIFDCEWEGDVDDDTEGSVVRLLDGKGDGADVNKTKGINVGTLVGKRERVCDGNTEAVVGILDCK